MIIGRHLETMANNMQTNGHSNGAAKRAMRIAGVSGGVFDRFRAMEDLSKDASIDGMLGLVHMLFTEV
jgi:hypothetical protein